MPSGGQPVYPRGQLAKEFGLHQPSAWDSPAPHLGECHREANPREAIRWGRPTRGFGQSATPRPTGQRPLHTASSCQVHPRGDTYFGGISNFRIIS
jgi:hypothetical protein